MADSSYEKGLSELSKMKVSIIKFEIVVLNQVCKKYIVIFTSIYFIIQVADLKVELKQRGLPTTGNKNELVERLQLAIHGGMLLIIIDSVNYKHVLTLNILIYHFRQRIITR